METLFVTREAKLRQHENTLSITLDDRTRSLPIESIGHLVLLGETRLNTRLLTLCGKHGVRISVFDYYGYCKGAFEPLDQNPAGLVKLKQAALLLDDRRRMAVARVAGSWGSDRSINRARVTLQDLGVRCDRGQPEVLPMWAEGGR